jgi:hypothetical protein
MISNADMFKQTARLSVGGKQMPGKDVEGVKLKVSKKVEDRLKNSSIGIDEYLTMLAFSKWRPDGNRVLKLNLPVLRDLMVAHDIAKHALSDSSGLKAGGKIATASNPTKVLKEMSQKQYLYTIKNNNRIVRGTNAFDGKDPDYTSFKNTMKID